MNEKTVLICKFFLKNFTSIGRLPIDFPKYVIRFAKYDFYRRFMTRFYLINNKSFNYAFKITLPFLLNPSFLEEILNLGVVLQNNKFLAVFEFYFKNLYFRFVIYFGLCGSFFALYSPYLYS